MKGHRPPIWSVFAAQMTAEGQRRLAEDVVREVFLDDPQFLCKIAEKVIQELLEANLIGHTGTPPLTSAPAHAPVTVTVTSRGRYAPG